MADDPYAALGDPVEAPANSADPYAQIAEPAYAPTTTSIRQITHVNGKPLAQPIEVPVDATDDQIRQIVRQHGINVSDSTAVQTADGAPVQEGMGERFLDDLKNDVAGIAQGVVALPDMAAKGAGQVMSIIPNLISHALDSAGYTDAAKWVQGHVTHNLANPVQLGNVVESASPTPNTTEGHVDRTIGQLVGGAAGFPQSAADHIVTSIVGEVPKALKLVEDAKPAATQIVKDAEQANIPVLTSDVKQPQTFVGKTAQAIGERIPITGTGSVREAQQTARIAAVKNIAQDYGVTSDALASPAIDDVAKDLANTRSDTLTKLTNQKNWVINKLQGEVQTPLTIDAIDEQIGKLKGINADAYKPVIDKLQQFREQLASGKTLAQIEGNRKLLGDMFSDPNLASIRGDGEKAINALYDPLRSDMGRFIKAYGEPGDFDKWKMANDQLAGMAGNLQNRALKTALSTADTTPENVARLLFSSKPSDVRLLYDNLSPLGKAKAQSAIIQRAIEKSGGLENISPDRFATQVKNLGNQVGVFFTNDSARLNGLQRVLSATQRASQAALAPPTGVQAVPYAMGAGFTHLFGLPGGVAAAAGTGLLARAYESPVVRDLLLRIGRSKPGSLQESALLERAASAIAAAVQKHVPEAINDNTLSAATAQPQEQNKQ